MTPARSMLTPPAWTTDVELARRARWSRRPSRWCAPSQSRTGRQGRRPRPRHRLRDGLQGLVARPAPRARRRSRIEAAVAAAATPTSPWSSSASPRSRRPRPSTSPRCPARRAGRAGLGRRRRGPAHRRRGQRRHPGAHAVARRGRRGARGRAARARRAATPSPPPCSATSSRPAVWSPPSRPATAPPRPGMSCPTDGRLEYTEGTFVGYRGLRGRQGHGPRLLVRPRPRLRDLGLRRRTGRAGRHRRGAERRRSR